MAEFKKKGSTPVNEKVTLLEALQKVVSIAIEGEELYSKVGKVTSVESNKTCTIQIDDEPELTGVKLQQVDNSLGLYVKPAINSVVIVSFTSNTNAFISMYSEIDSIVFQDGDNEGLAKVIALTDKLNALENGYNSLVAKFNTHIHVSTVTIGTLIYPCALAPTVTPETTVLTPTTKAEIQNSKFKH